MKTIITAFVAILSLNSFAAEEHCKAVLDKEMTALDVGTSTNPIPALKADPTNDGSLTFRGANLKITYDSAASRPKGEPAQIQISIKDIFGNSSNKLILFDNDCYVKDIQVGLGGISGFHLNTKFCAQIVNARKPSGDMTAAMKNPEVFEMARGKCEFYRPLFKPLVIDGIKGEKSTGSR